jgi:hypothetical protein
VKYHEKVWLLLTSAGGKYHWVDQDIIPVAQLKGIKFTEEYEDNQEELTRMLEDLQREKDMLVK